MKTPRLLLLLCLILVALFLLSLSLGASRIPLATVFRALTGDASGNAVTILRYVRLPRTIAALMAGGALALSGLLLQSSLNNPLASAGTIGVNAGSGLCVVLGSLLFPGMFIARPVFAFTGAFLSAISVFAIARKLGAGRTVIILAGIALSSLLSAGTDMVVTIAPDTLMDRTSFFIGGFAHIQNNALRYTLPFFITGFAGAVALSPFLNVLALGDEVAASLGLHVALCRFCALLCAALLAASAVCIGGLLGFVGLIVPHGARLLAGTEHRLLTPLTLLGGGALVLGCDILARLLFVPYEMPVGILLAFLGAPFFLLLLLEKRRRNAA
jgi:iron complex transport system permease protein